MYFKPGVPLHFTPGYEDGTHPELQQPGLFIDANNHGTEIWILAYLLNSSFKISLLPGTTILFAILQDRSSKVSLEGDSILLN
jgi:hypothetical protein